MSFVSLTSLIEKSSKYFQNKAIRFVKGNEEIVLSYKEFFIFSDSVADYLLNLLTSEALEPHSFVGVHCNVTYSFPCIVYGILKAGLAFVPLDPLNGRLWNEQIIDKLGISLFIVNEKDALCDTKLIHSIKILHECIYFRFSDRNKSHLNGEGMAYSVQTSGTTGSPKIIRVPHKAIVPNILDLRELFRVSSEDVIYLASAITFDPSVIEIFLALSSGASLLIVNKHVQDNSEDLCNALFPSNSDSITILQITPSKFLRLSIKVGMNRIFGKKSRLRIVAFGGEKFPNSEIIKKWKMPVDIDVYNLYGISEVSCWAALAKLIYPENYGLPITLNEGDLNMDLSELFLTPLSETILEVRNVNKDNIGEMYIGSSTRVCLIDDESWEDLRDSVVFRPTGDLFQVINGKYVFTSRKNDEVKRFGVKMNLKCLERLAEENPDVERAICISCERHSDTPSIGLILVPRLIDDYFCLDNFKLWLKEKCSQGIWPDRIQTVQYIPLTKHGKIDEKALCDLIFGKTLEKDVLTLFSSLWSNYTVNKITEDKGFISSGGTSFSALQFISELQIYTDVKYDFIANLVQDVKFRNCLQELKSVKLLKDQMKSNVLKNQSNAGRLNKLDLNLERRDNVKFFINWRYNLDKCIDASPICVFFNKVNYVIIGSHSGRVAVLNSEDGTLVSEICLPDRVESTACMDTSRGQFAIGCYDHYIYMLNLKSEVVWSFKTNNIVKSSPTITEDLLICGSYDKYVYCLNCIYGNLIWKQEVGGQILAKVQTIDSRVLVATLKGCVKALCIIDGTPVWSLDIKSPIFSNFIISSENIGVVAGVQGNLHWFSISTGEQISEFKCDGNVFSSLTRHEKSIIFGTTDGWLYNINRNTAALVWKKLLDSRLVSAPLVVNFGDLLNRTTLSSNSLNLDAVIVVASSKGCVYLLNIEDGQEITSIILQGEIYSSPSFQKNSIQIGCRDNYVYSLSLKYSTE